MAGNYLNTGSWVPNVYSGGLRNVGAFRVSGTPWITGSTIKGNEGGIGGIDGEDLIQFPYVTKSIMITRVTAAEDIRVHFAAKAEGNTYANKHYLSLSSNDQTITLNVKCKEIYLSIASTGTNTGIYELFAELTNIPTSSMFDLTGSGITA